MSEYNTESIDAIIQATENLREADRMVLAIGKRIDELEKEIVARRTDLVKYQAKFSDAKRALTELLIGGSTGPRVRSALE